jgi:enoyl-CoA hydratase/carnithine racemase
MSDAPELVVERDGPVVVLRLNRPEARNALTTTLLEDLGRALLAAEADDTVRAVVLTGTGDRAFSSGLDLRAFAGGSDMTAVAPEAWDAYLRLLRSEITVPVVGAANATALAGGLELLLGCDLVVASAEAELGLPEVRRGLFPGGNGTAIGRHLPLAVALEMALTGTSISAERAHALGLVNAVVPPDEVLPTAVGLAQRIAANAPLGVAACRELVRLSAVGDPTAPDRLRHWQQVVFQSEDAREGATAFVERRDPVWRGR